MDICTTDERNEYLKGRLAEVREERDRAELREDEIEVKYYKLREFLQDERDRPIYNDPECIAVHSVETKERKR